MEGDEIIMHYWGENASSPCGRSVYTAYSMGGHGYTSDKKGVDCPECVSKL